MDFSIFSKIKELIHRFNKSGKKSWFAETSFDFLFPVAASIQGFNSALEKETSNPWYINRLDWRKHINLKLEFSGKQLAVKIYQRCIHLLNILRVKSSSATAKAISEIMALLAPFLPANLQLELFDISQFKGSQRLLLPCISDYFRKFQSYSRDKIVDFWKFIGKLESIRYSSRQLSFADIK